MLLPNQSCYVKYLSQVRVDVDEKSCKCIADDLCKPLRSVHFLNTSSINSLKYKICDLSISSSMYSFKYLEKIKER